MDEIKYSSASEIGGFLANSFYVISGRVGVLGLMTAVTLVLTRYLGPAEYGIYAIVYAIANIFSIAFDFGFITLFVRDASLNKSMAAFLLSDMFLLKIIIVSVSFLLMIFCAWLMHYSWEIIGLLAIGGLETVLLNFSLTTRSLFYIHQELVYESGFLLGEALVRLILLLLGVLMKWHLGALLWMFASVGALSFMSSIIVCRSKYKLGMPKVNWVYWKKLLVMAFPFFLIGIIGRAYTRLDIILVSKWLAADFVGLYGAAKRLLDVPLFLPFTLCAVALPILSKNYESNIKEFERFSAVILRLLIIGALPLTGIVLLYSREITVLLFGLKFQASSPLMKILFASLPFMFVNALLGTMLYASKRQQVVLINSGVCLLFNTLINVLLIPVLKTEGAAFTVVGTEMLLSFLNIYAFKKYKLKIGDLKYLISLIITFIGMVLAGKCLGNAPFLVGIVVSLLTYSVLSIALKVVTINQIRYVLPKVNKL